MSRTNAALLCALLGSGLLLGSTGRAQQPAKTEPIMPAAPATLLACLPPTIQGWTVTRSNAASSFTQWVTTIANREFKQNPPPPDPNNPAPTPFVPGVLTSHVTDSGYSTNYAAGFVAPAGESVKNTVFLKVGDYPARKYKPDDTTIILSVLVKGRFVVEMRARNMQEKDLMGFMSRVNYQQLLAIPDTGPHEIPSPVNLTRVDELDPKQNRTYPLYWSKAEQ